MPGDPRVNLLSQAASATIRGPLSKSPGAELAGTDVGTAKVRAGLARAAHAASISA